MQQGPGHPRPRQFPRGSIGAEILAPKLGDVREAGDIFVGSPVHIPGEFYMRQHSSNRLSYLEILVWHGLSLLAVCNLT